MCCPECGNERNYCLCADYKPAIFTKQLTLFAQLFLLDFGRPFLMEAL
jgi:hypothetical protein